jgi:hypothetical protein
MAAGNTEVAALEDSGEVVSFHKQDSDMKSDGKLDTGCGISSCALVEYQDAIERFPSSASCLKSSASEREEAY